MSTSYRLRQVFCLSVVAAVIKLGPELLVRVKVNSGLAELENALGAYVLEVDLDPSPT